MVGIYKITSPSGKINIGQTWDIDLRKGYYSRLECKGQTKLYNSLVKYGWPNHVFEVIHELPEDVTQCILDQYETLYWQQYKDLGFEMLNIKEPGRGGRWSEEMKIKFKEKRNNKEWKKFISNIHKGKIVSQETRNKQSRFRKGKKHSEETMIKIFNRPKLTLNQIRKRIEKTNKPVICINTGKIFESIKNAAEYFKLDPSGVGKVARGINRKVGKDKLIFKFL